MVRPRAAGVAFTLEPAERRPVRRSPSTRPGASARASCPARSTPDNFLVDKVIGRDRPADHLAEDHRVPARPTTTRSTQVEVDARTRRSARASPTTRSWRSPGWPGRAEKHYGCPQDIEWAVDGRPARRGERRPAAGRPETVWSREDPPRRRRDDGPDTEHRARPSCPAVRAQRHRRHAAGWPITADVRRADWRPTRHRSEEEHQWPIASRARSTCRRRPAPRGGSELYTYSSLFSEDRREYEDVDVLVPGRRALARGDPTPWDATFLEFALASLSQYNTRHYVVPPALGVDFRILNGYVYLSPVPVADPAEIEARVPQFMERAGFYFANWDQLYDDWLVKIRALVERDEPTRLRRRCRRCEDIEVVTSGRGMGIAATTCWRRYHRLLDLALKLWQYHFEFLNLGYAAYLDFFGFCKQAFPSIPDLAIAKMVAGVDVDLFRPDEELKKLARLAVELGRRRAFAAATAAGGDRARCGDPRPARAGSRRGRRPRAVVQLLDRVGLLPHRQDLDRERRRPVRLHPRLHRQGAARATTWTGRSRRVHAERDRDRGRVPRAARLRRGPRGVRGQARPVPHGVPVRREPQLLRRALGPLGAVAQDARRSARCSSRRGLLRGGRRHLPASSATRSPTRCGTCTRPGPSARRRAARSYWPRGDRAAQAASIDALRPWSPPPALGVPPEVVTEPFTVMLWGITSDSVGLARRGDGPTTATLSGFAASPGRGRGPGPGHLLRRRDRRPARRARSWSRRSPRRPGRRSSARSRPPSPTSAG